MKQIILVRHGETEWNVEEVYRGTRDIELNEAGIKQADLLGRYLSDWKLEAVYSSPLKRALDTANTIARYQDISVQVTNDLIDFNYGEWQGRSAQEVKKLYPTLHDEWHNNPHKVKMPRGESLADVTKRANAIVNKVVTEYEGSIVLVSDRVVNKVLICSLLGLDNSHFWNIQQDVCGITIFNYVDGLFILTRHNDTSHLKGIQEHLLSDF